MTKEEIEERIRILKGNLIFGSINTNRDKIIDEIKELEVKLYNMSEPIKEMTKEEYFDELEKRGF